MELMLYDGLNVSINPFQADPESLWDSKTIGIAWAAEVIVTMRKSRASWALVKRALAVNNIELVLLKRLSFSRLIDVYT